MGITTGDLIFKWGQRLGQSDRRELERDLEDAGVKSGPRNVLKVAPASPPKKVSKPQIKSTRKKAARGTD